MASSEERDVRQAVAAVEDLIDRAVRATIEDRSPEPGRQVVAAVREIDAGAAPQDRSGPVELIATLQLVGRLSAAREAEDRPADLVDTALAWVGEHLGGRYRARARYVSGLLESAGAAADVPHHRTALRDDFLPAMVWLVAGVDAAAAARARAEAL
ncbi:MAG: hypothetical protein NTW05_08000 [Pseudonocardiales bacterium]|nr:hypothetical protein [Pseudonocardiales bacterium]